MSDSSGEMRTARQWSLLTLVPYSTIRAAVRSGQLPAMRFTPKGQIYIAPEDMDRFIKEARVRAQTDDE